MPPPKPWLITELGAGRVTQPAGELRLALPPASAASYHDAQISDYQPAERNFSNSPPVSLELSARASGEIGGTAGFGFWNQAFVPGLRGFRPPQALWFFFGGPANDIALAKGLPGNGWKAATFNASNWRFYASLPLAPLGFLLMRSQTLYDALWHLGQAAIGVSEAALQRTLLDDFHRYRLEWRRDGAIFSVDGDIVLQAPAVPSGPLGFIAWIDNQYAIVKPQGAFGHGLVDIKAETSLHLRDISITRL